MNRQKRSKKKRTFAKEAVARAKAKTPSFWLKLRRAGLTIAGVAGGIVTAAIGGTIALPATVVAAASYLALGGGVVGGISFFGADEKDINEQLNTGNDEDNR